MNNKVNKLKSFAKHIDNEFRETVQTIKEYVKTNDFHSILATIKNSETNKSRIDTYHSVYAQARGLFIMSLLNYILIIGYTIITSGSICLKYLSMFLVIDTIMMCVFLPDCTGIICRGSEIYILSIGL